MNYRRYSLYNLVGAVIWGIGLTFAGYLVGFIPPIADFVRNYIDVILIAAVVLTILPTAYHYVQSTRKARRAQREGVQPLSDGEAVVDPAYFDNDPSNDPPRR
jgi:membrane-associated protein